MKKDTRTTRRPYLQAWGRQRGQNVSAHPGEAVTIRKDGAALSIDRDEVLSLVVALLQVGERSA